MFFIYFWASPLWDFVYDFSFRFGGTISTLQVHRKAPEKERVCVSWQHYEYAEGSRWLWTSSMQHLHIKFEKKLGWFFFCSTFTTIIRSYKLLNPLLWLEPKKTLPVFSRLDHAEDALKTKMYMGLFLWFRLYNATVTKTFKTKMLCETKTMHGKHAWRKHHESHMFLSLWVHINTIRIPQWHGYLELFWSSS